MIVTTAAPRLAPALRTVLLVAGLVALLIAITRLPVAPRYLYSFDTVNFALALDQFDPRLGQPQPPGYPLFIAQARLLRLFFGTPERTFVACGTLAGIAAPVLLFMLGARMYSGWAGIAAALLLALTPAFWHSTLASPLRPYLAVVTVLVAYLCHRSAAGEPRFAYFAAAALGLGAGWRPSLLALLFPVWLVCAWLGLRSLGRMCRALAVLAAAALTWFLPLVVVVGGPEALWEMLTGYLGEQSQGNSPVYGAGFWEWWKMVTQVFVWEGLAVVGWFWAALLLLLPGPRSKVQGPRSERPGFDLGPGTWDLGPSNPAGPLPNWAFILLWVGPAAIFFKLIHVASPGHTLSLVPALCVLGGAFLEWGAARVGQYLPRNYAPRWAFLAVALAINVGFFTYPFRIPHARLQVRGTLPRVVEHFRFWGYFALRDTSYVPIRLEDVRTGGRIGRLRALGDASDLTIVWQDDDVSWRKLAYYFPKTRIWVIQGVSGPDAVPAPLPYLWLYNRILEVPDRKPPVVVRLPAGRVAWLLHLHSPFPQELRAQGVPLLQFGPLHLTDLRQAPAQFRAGNFLFERVNSAQSH
jgi:hypothetical protein